MGNTAGKQEATSKEEMNVEIVKALDPDNIDNKYKYEMKGNGVDRKHCILKETSQNGRLVEDLWSLSCMNWALFGQNPTKPDEQKIQDIYHNLFMTEKMSIGETRDVLVPSIKSKPNFAALDDTVEKKILMANYKKAAEDSKEQVRKFEKYGYNSMQDATENPCKQNGTEAQKSCTIALMRLAASVAGLTVVEENEARYCLHMRTLEWWSWHHWAIGVRLPNKSSWSIIQKVPGTMTEGNKPIPKFEKISAVDKAIINGSIFFGCNAVWDEALDEYIIYLKDLNWVHFYVLGTAIEQLKNKDET